MIYPKILPTGGDILDNIYVEGDDDTKSRIREFLLLCKDRFSRELQPEPANIPHRQLDVDVER